MEENKCSCHHCEGDCDGCNEEMFNACPVCGQVGMNVSLETIESLVKKEVVINSFKDKETFLCINRQCQVAYYVQEDKVLVNQVKVPIWFKYEKDEYMVCYCRRITLDDIIEAVKSINQDKIAISDVLHYLNKEDVLTDCLHNNPTGICCDKLFENAIKYAKSK